MSLIKRNFSKNSPVTGSGGLHKNSCVKMSKLCHNVKNMSNLSNAKNGPVAVVV